MFRKRRRPEAGQISEEGSPPGSGAAPATAPGNTVSPASPQTGTDDAEDYGLMQRVAHGEPDAILTLMKKHGKAIEATLKRLMKDPARRIEVLQSFWGIKLPKEAHTFLPGRPLTPWLCLVAKRHCIDQGRIDDRIRVNEISDRHRTPDGEEWSTFDRTPTEPLVAFRDGIAIRHLARCMRSLPYRTRLIVCWKELDEKTYQEIAGLLDMAVSSVHKVHHQALAALRSCMEAAPRQYTKTTDRTATPEKLR